MGGHELNMQEARRDVVLVLGRTRVGKSIMTEVLFGDPSALESTKDTVSLCCKIKNTKEKQKKKKSSSVFKSNTICPQLFTDPEKPSLAIYDCPGFNDTRGTSNEIATCVYLRDIVEHANQVKIVVAVDYNTINVTAEPSKFVNGVLPEVLDFVLSEDVYDGGVFLLITKYANPMEDSHNKFKDDDIIESIASFLEEAQKHAVTCAKNKKRKNAINAVFKQSWLRKTVDGKYSNIDFSRTITSEGNLGNMESLTRRQHIRNRLLDNPNFNFRISNPRHFGHTISDAAKLKVRRTQSDLTLKAGELLTSVNQKIIAKYDNENNFHNLFDEFRNDVKDATQRDPGLSHNSLQILLGFGKIIGANIRTEVRQLGEIIGFLKHLTDMDVEQSSETWSDVHKKWNSAMENLEDNVAKLKTERDHRSQMVLAAVAGTTVAVGGVALVAAALPYGAIAGAGAALAESPAVLAAGSALASAALTAMKKNP